MLYLLVLPALVVLLVLGPRSEEDLGQLGLRQGAQAQRRIVIVLVRTVAARWQVIVLLLLLLILSSRLCKRTTFLYIPKKFPHNGVNGFKEKLALFTFYMSEGPGNIFWNSMRPAKVFKLNFHRFSNNDN